MNKKKARLIFGQAVKRLRKERSWTQKELAKRAKISRSYLQRIEGKKSANVSVDTIKKIANAFKVEMSNLFF